MRLRSSQFVMLLLLACSVQVGEAYAFRLMAGQVFHAGVLSTEALVAAKSRAHRAASVPDRPTVAFRLNPDARRAERTALSMPYPASAAAAVTSFTGLLRA